MKDFKTFLNEGKQELVESSNKSRQIKFHEANKDIIPGNSGVNYDGTPNKNITILGKGTILIKENNKIYISDYNRFDNEVTEIILDPSEGSQLKKAL